MLIEILCFLQERDGGDPEQVPDVNESTPGDYASCGPAVSAYSAVPCQAVMPCSQAATVSKPDDITYTTPVFAQSQSTQQGDEINRPEPPNVKITYAEVSYNVGKQAVMQASAEKPAKAAKPVISKPKPDAENTYDRVGFTVKPSDRNKNDELADDLADIEGQLSTPETTNDIYGVPFSKSSSTQAEEGQGDLYSRSTVTKYRYISPTSLELGKIVASGYVFQLRLEMLHSQSIVEKLVSSCVFAGQKI